jgi:hypothetical protein
MATLVLASPSECVLVDTSTSVTKHVSSSGPVSFSADGRVLLAQQKILTPQGQLVRELSLPSEQATAAAVTRDGSVYLAVDSEIFSFQGGEEQPNKTLDVRSNITLTNFFLTSTG